MNSVKNIMHEWFLHLWDRTSAIDGSVQCFECNKTLHADYYRENTCCYSHILGKKQYPKFKGDPNNVKIVCPDCHNIYTMTPKKAVKQYAEYIKLIKKYNL